MDYMISRDGQEYGPYTLADLQRYVASGEILLTDMARSEGMTDFLAVSQVIGTIPVPAQLTHVSFPDAMPDYSNPPNLHWALVLLFGLLTRGLFMTVWGLVLAVWVRKYLPKSRAMFYYIGYGVSLLLLFVMAVVAAFENARPEFVGLLVGTFALVSIALMLIARYSLRSSLEEHYNTNEPMNLELSAIMTFFFGEIYFQYHVNNIVRRKKLDRLSLSTY